MITVQVKNHSTVVADLDVERVVEACQVQIDRDFSPVYGIKAKVEFVAADAPLSQYDWQLLVVDNADQAGALGYHEVAANGSPIGYCFAKTTKEDGGNWTVTFSHELLELLADPEINLCALDEAGQKLYAAECCDACEADELSYVIGDVHVSDFVLPAFWMSSTPTHAPLSFTGAVTQPLQILPGGYLAHINMRDTGAGWQQTFADKASSHGSRLARRRVPAAQRKKSTAQ